MSANILVHQTQRQMPAAPGAARIIDPNDFSDRFNTKLSDQDEQKFLQWQKQHPGIGSTYDYDARGFWKSGAATAANGHGADRFKKPNHPTFSDQSMYHSDQTPGGKWTEVDGKYTFKPSPFNLKMNSADELRQYWNRVEAPAGNTLDLSQ